MSEYQHHYSTKVKLKASVAEAFAYLSDPQKLSSHMGKSSWMMGGAAMSIRLDEKNGKTLGSEIVLEGKMMGMPLFVREIVTECVPPTKKTWETRGPQKMIVIDQYQMGFEISEEKNELGLTVFINYNTPQTGIGKWFGNSVASRYAKWCVRQMADDANAHFSEIQI